MSARKDNPDGQSCGNCKLSDCGKGTRADGSLWGWCYAAALEGFTKASHWCECWIRR